MANRRLLEWIHQKTAKLRPVKDILPPQPTPSASRESLLISATDAVTESPFFRKLPFEIRDMILMHAFAEYTIHMTVNILQNLLPPSKRAPGQKQMEQLQCYVCPVPDSMRTLRDGLRPSSEYCPGYQSGLRQRCYGQWCTCPVQGLESGCWYIGIMGWLLPCRQAYDECIDILYAQNTIQMDSGFVGLLPEMIFPQRLSSITSFEVHQADYSFRMAKKSISETHESILLRHSLKDILPALPHLRKLYPSIEGHVFNEPGPVHKTIVEVLEQNFMIPMDNLLRKSDLQLQECNMSIHVSHHDRPFAADVRSLEFSHFQGHWSRYEQNIRVDDKSLGGTCDESLTLRDPGSPSYTLQAVPQFRA